jgi:hypothetical protein
LILATLELVQPDLEWSIADQLNVFPAEDFVAIVGVELAVTRRDIHNFGGVEANRLSNDPTPLFPKCPLNDIEVRSGWTGGNPERDSAGSVRQF